MAISRRSLSAVLSFSLAILTARKLLASATILLLVAASMAQPQTTKTTTEPDPQAQSADSAEPESGGQEEAPITVPAGTRLALVLTHPVDSKSMHRGDEIYAQTTAPVAVGDQVVIPAGTFVQGQIEKVSRKGNRGEFLMQSISVLFPDGYAAHVTGPMKIESDEGTAWRVPSGRAATGAIIAPLVGTGIGAWIGSSVHTTQTSTLGDTTMTSSTPKGLAIGSMAGLAAGGVVSLVLLARSHNFYVEVGSPMELTLPQPLTLSANQVSDAVWQAQGSPVILPPKPRRQPGPTPPDASPFPQTPSSTDTGTCYTPGTPATYIPGTPGTGGTPDVYIPGTPAIGGSPGTPDTYIPGTPGTGGTPGTYIPGTPPTQHPCP